MRVLWWESIQWNWRKPKRTPEELRALANKESIQWNWRSQITDPAQWERVGYMNPFNGIEGADLTTLEQALHVIWIHSMELKGKTTLLQALIDLTPNPFNGIEGAVRRGPGWGAGCGIHSMELKARTVRDSSNPASGCRIHSMELKDHQPTHSLGLTC